uniref:Uncharacterized protein n=1 Tax=Timspurckia oligopyrenoides TaxID=708627 RepID=A0A7S0ZG00_9RHOD|mmetsp:Transcript_3793/g.6626  ORF Transcript_3793/g.6626 Transcript_3793/m.6626 type:complete len:481 (+) Transcript_3793:51-1493(+)|eukprot:CAMPEP_0182449042 /NCGR_PEP_ID=MMETSP1172-20130603/31482_1 /TAXON_ID=708627 /ORGANISM="Timspurckia oligopyrenoides, Strain CCMP3278" /LENGTH=480 /DNA_ID=CAMNT_0024646135 /DNA_START=41 /DNA_END=1483 /DNA_ORIENTATION=-
MDKRGVVVSIIEAGKMLRELGEFRRAQSLSTRMIDHAIQLASIVRPVDTTSTQNASQHAFRLHASLRESNNELKKLFQIAQFGGFPSKYAALHIQDTFARQLGLQSIVYQSNYDKLQLITHENSDDSHLLLKYQSTLRLCLSSLRSNANSVEIITKVLSTIDEIVPNHDLNNVDPEFHWICGSILTCRQILLNMNQGLAQTSDEKMKYFMDSTVAPLWTAVNQLEQSAKLGFHGCRNSLALNALMIGELARKFERKDEADRFFDVSKSACDKYFGKEHSLNGNTKLDKIMMFCRSKCGVYLLDAKDESDEDRMQVVYECVRELRKCCVESGEDEKEDKDVRVISALRMLGEENHRQGNGLEAEGILRSAVDKVLLSATRYEVFGERERVSGRSEVRVVSEACECLEALAQLVEKLSWNNQSRIKEAEASRYCAETLKSLFPEANLGGETATGSMWFGDEMEALCEAVLSVDKLEDGQEAN